MITLINLISNDIEKKYYATLGNNKTRFYITIEITEEEFLTLELEIKKTRG